MEKYIIAVIMGCIVLLTIFLPVYLIILGFYYATIDKFLLGCGLVFLGLVVLRLIKPISIITGKDYKIF